MPRGHPPETSDPQLRIYSFHAPCPRGGMRSGSEQHGAGGNLTSYQWGLIIYTLGHPWEPKQSPDTLLCGQVQSERWYR